MQGITVLALQTGTPGGQRPGQSRLQRIVRVLFSSQVARRLRDALGQSSAGERVSLIRSRLPPARGRAWRGGSVALGQRRAPRCPRPPAASLAQRLALERKVLVVSGHTGVVEAHGAETAGRVVQNFLGMQPFCNGQSARPAWLGVSVAELTNLATSYREPMSAPAATAASQLQNVVPFWFIGSCSGM